LQRDLEWPRNMDDARGVNQVIAFPAARGSGCDDLGPARLGCNIGQDELRPRRFKDIAGAVADIDGQDLAACPQQTLCDRPTDAAGGASDNCAARGH
jgi:hypothetical protein